MLRGAGFDPEIVISGIDEELDEPDTRALVVELAERKAKAVARRVGDSIIVGCDSMFEIDGIRRGKPRSTDEALDWAVSARGREGQLHTGHCVIDGRTRQRACGVATTVVRFGHATDAELEAYVATGEPLSVAGGFTLDGRSSPFIEGVDGDPGNVIGLSLPLLRTLLAELDVRITDLWV